MSELPIQRLTNFVTKSSGRKQAHSYYEDCTCPQCDLTRIKRALRWYQEEARAIAKNMELKADQAVLASITVLARDSGKRSIDVLGESE